MPQTSYAREKPVKSNNRSINAAAAIVGREGDGAHTKLTKDSKRLTTFIESSITTAFTNRGNLRLKLVVAKFVTCDYVISPRFETAEAIQHNVDSVPVNRIYTPDQI
jgi:hypothetical protein